MAVWKRLNGKKVKPNEKGYARAIWQVSGQFKGVVYKESVPLAETKQDAEDREREIKSLILSSDYESAKRKTTFADYVDQTYLPRVKTENESWKNNKKYQIERLKSFFGSYPLKSINRALCERFRDKRKTHLVICQRCALYKPTCYLCDGEKKKFKNKCWRCEKRKILFDLHRQSCKPPKVKSSTVNRDLTTLSDIFTDAVVDGEIKENPMRFVKQLTEPEARTRILTTAEKKRIFEILGNEDISPVNFRLRALILITVTTGWRMGRIMKLQKEHLDYRHRTVRVSKSKQDEAKETPVSEITWHVLTELAELVGCGHLFINTQNGKPLLTFPRESWQKLLKDAGIEDLTFHDLRATFGTELVLEGASLFHAQKALDHKKVTTTQRYVRIAEDSMRSHLENHGKNYEQFVERQK